jgi:hypothetical protein
MLGSQSGVTCRPKELNQSNLKKYIIKANTTGAEASYQKKTKKDI